MKPKVLIVSAVFPPEQVTSALMNYDLAIALSEFYDVIVLRPYPTRPQGVVYSYQEGQTEPFDTVLINSYTNPQSNLLGRFRESLDFGNKCARYIKKHHRDLAFIYNNCWQLFGVGIVAKTAKKYGIPYNVTIQDIYPECLFTNRKHGGILMSLGKALLLPIDCFYQKNASFVRTISDEMANYLSKTRKIPRNHYLVVNNWQNDEDFSKTVSTNKRNNCLVFAYVGSINVHANVELIIRSFHNAQLQNAELRIYGGGNRAEQCKLLASELGLTNISFNIVSRDKVPQVQNEADVLVLALPKGNGEFCLPSKITSYMLSGKPIMASVDLGSATERYLLESGCGIVIESDNEEALTDAFRKVSKLDINELENMGVRGKQYAMNNLTKKVNLGIVVESIKKCI